jgi:hypothetical protein
MKSIVGPSRFPGLTEYSNREAAIKELHFMKRGRRFANMKTRLVCLPLFYRGDQAGPQIDRQQMHNYLWIRRGNTQTIPRPFRKA